MTIIESNKLIAEFMRLELEETLHGLKVYAVKINRNNPLKLNDIETEFFLVEELKYHLSWDWLMPVVERIELMNKDTGFMGIFTLYGLGRTKVQCYNNDTFCYEADMIDNRYGIQPTYQAVVKFIEWYNKNNK
jgi:hypothetical protein